MEKGKNFLLWRKEKPCIKILKKKTLLRILPSVIALDFSFIPPTADKTAQNVSK